MSERCNSILSLRWLAFCIFYLTCSVKSALFNSVDLLVIVYSLNFCLLTLTNKSAAIFARLGKGLVSSGAEKVQNGKNQANSAEEVHGKAEISTGLVVQVCAKKRSNCLPSAVKSTKKATEHTIRAIQASITRYLLFDC